MMQEKPSAIQREAKSLLSGLKELIKKNGQLDREVDFQRKNLRSQYLRLLLSHPYARESKDVETHLWMQTSYQFISIFKQKISALDRKLYGRSTDNGSGGGEEKRGDSGFVEYRKLLQRFRQFLSDEEKFFSQLLVRLDKVFDLEAVRPTLLKLNLSPVDEYDLSNRNGGRDVLPEQQTVDEPSQEQRENMIVVFGKFLVCLGDIARYREHYNDNDGRPRAGTEQAVPHKATRKDKRGSKSTPRPRNYHRSRNIYEQARFLAPDDGNASHQLAVLSAYEKDDFSTLCHYYRALCVRVPYEPASENLANFLRKAVEQYRMLNREEINEGARKDPKLRLARFKSWMVLLHGLWNLNSDDSADKSTKLAKSVGLEFAALVTDRLLSPETITQVIMLSLGALWKLRIVRDTKKALESPRNKLVEPLMLIHILDLAQTLCNSGYASLSDDSDIRQREDLGQRIPAVLRRTLPSIRVFMKWLRSNFSYVLSVNLVPSSENLEHAIDEFWREWAMFCGVISDVFPVTQLPTSATPLEEDVEMTGFSPIKRQLFTKARKSDDGLALDRAQVHPNEEFLMRIADLLIDAQSISGSEGCPVVRVNNAFVFGNNHSTEDPFIKSPVDGLAEIMERHPDPPRTDRLNDDESTTQTSRTEDDLAGEAVRAALAAGAVDEEEEDEQIVWPLREAPLRSLEEPTRVAEPLIPTHLEGKAINEMRPQAASTTAQDLLNGVLGNNIFGGSALKAQFAKEPGVPSPATSLLFGSGSPHAQRASIWSNVDDEFQLSTGMMAPNYTSPQRQVPSNNYQASPFNQSNALGHHLQQVVPMASGQFAGGNPSWPVPSFGHSEAGLPSNLSYSTDNLFDGAYSLAPGAAETSKQQTRTQDVSQYIWSGT